MSGEVGEGRLERVGWRGDVREGRLEKGDGEKGSRKGDVGDGNVYFHFPVNSVNMQTTPSLGASEIIKILTKRKDFITAY